MSRNASSEGGHFHPSTNAAPNANGYADHEHLHAETQLRDDIVVKCGPLINYQHMNDENGQISWHGSVLIVTKPTQAEPILHLRPRDVSGVSQDAFSMGSTKEEAQTVNGLRLYQDRQKTFWRFSLALALVETETEWEYTIPNMHIESKASSSTSRTFVVPSKHESMRIMFHSCNGFSVGTDEEFWSGPALWNDVVRVHKKRPFHVMIGGGDQMYNDGVRVDGPLKEWTDISNPIKRREHPFDESLRAACDEYYFQNYVRWYSTEPFASANAAIPQINIWDDHDIIDGFGSYTDGFMRCPVFRGIGGVSFKYYCLFQHHTAPPRSSFVSNVPAVRHKEGGDSADHGPPRVDDTYVYPQTADDPSWIVGNMPGPYIEERSRSIYARLGKNIAFVGVDARTERTRKRVNYSDTYDLIFDRLRSEVITSKGSIKHLILLLGVPIAYPRLAWLENLFTSPIVAPIRLLNKRFGFAGGLFNEFDGSVDLLDDLDDHYTSKHHKAERRNLILRLQEFAAEFSIRVTILGGDVHLAAIGRFYSNHKTDVDAEHDFRYMTNIISSAITNHPPPKAVANLLARRNKIHHLRDGHTDETLLKFFDKQPGGQVKGADWNQCTMPSRNYACITEVTGGPADIPAANGTDSNTHTNALQDKIRSVTKTDGHAPLHAGEENAGTVHAAADGVSNSTAMIGGLDVCIRVEIDNTDPEGRTDGYGMTIPLLTIHK